MKFRVKVGKKFELKLKIETEDEDAKQGLKGWKSLAVLSVTVLLACVVGYAIVTKDWTPMYKTLDALVSVGKAAVETKGGG